MPEIAKIRIIDPRDIRSVAITYPSNEIRTIGVSNLVSTGGGGGGSGTVTSVGLSLPTGFTVSGSPVTSSGTLAASFSSGYQAFTSAESSKLAGIESGATGDQSAAEILAALLTVDGPGSGLNADLLDGNSSAAFALAGHDHSGVYQPADAQLSDLAALSYSGNGLKVLRVNSGETGFELATISTGGVTSVSIGGNDGISVVSGSPITSSGTIQLGIDATTLKNHLDLASVENTALSTWAGSANIATVGTIGTGTWQATAIGDDYISSATTWNGKLDSISGQSIGDLSDVDLSGAVDNDLLRLSSGVFVTVSLSEAGIQAQSGNLDSVAGLSYASNALKVVRVNAGETGFELATISAGGGDALTSGTLDQFADVTQTGGATLAIGASTTLSGGTHSGTNTGNVTLSGTPDYLTISGQVITLGQIDLATDVTGDLPLANLAAASAASKLLGRGSASGSGDFQEITIGSGLSMSGTTLSASGGGGTTIAKKGSLENITSTSLADIAGLSHAMEADKEYAGEAFVIWSSDAAGSGVRFGLNGSASAADVFYHGSIDRSGAFVGVTGYATAYGTEISTGTTGSTSARVAIICFRILNGGSASTLSIQCGTETGTQTIAAGSYLKISEVNT